MKKFIFVAIISALVLSVSSCKKDDNSSLAGTSWKATGTETWDEGTYTWTEIISFKTASTGTFSYSDTDGDTDSANFTYTYEHPVVTITVDGESTTGTISGNKLIPDDGDYTYTKQ